MTYQSRTITSAVLIILAIAWSGASKLSGQQASRSGTESRFTGLKWRSIGPNRGGRSIAAAGSASRPFEYYFGATGGGLWKTTDGGVTWKPVSDTSFKTSSVSAVAVSESNPDVVYVGMGETELRGNIIQGDGVYKSSDAGKTWNHVGLADTQSIARIRVHPTNPDVAWVAALGHPYGPHPDRGIFRTTDGGKNWQKVLFRDERTGAVDLAVDPKNPDVLYAGLWEVFRTPHSLSSGGPGSGIFKSTDGGVNWTEMSRNPGLPTGILGKIGLAVSGGDSGRVYAMVEAADGGLFVSDDGGLKWTKVNDERKLRQRAFYYTRVYADPKSRDVVYVLNTSMYRSTDGGKTHKSIKVPHGDNHDLWIASNDPARMINANDGGANVSINGGETWTDQDFPTAQMYHVTTTRHVPYQVCGAQQDNSTVCVPSTGTGDTWFDAGGGESGYLASDPRNPDILFAGSYGGYLTRLDHKTGLLRNVQVWPDNPMGYSAKDIAERFQWTYPIVFSPVDASTLYVASQHLWRSTNEGQSWERISPDLTRADPSTMGPSGGPITLDQTGVETYATIFTVAPSHQDAGTIWTGSDDGVVQITRDGGKAWTVVTPKDLPEFCRISLIEASPHKNGTAYLAANRYQRDDWGAYVYRTEDFGANWTRISSAIVAGDFARAIREDTKRPGLLYLGTERGIYVSFDNGSRWESLSLNLPVTPVHDLVVEDRDLVIATHGRSFYILDNIGPIRQSSPDTWTKAVQLFDPMDPLRLRDGSVAIDYFLKDKVELLSIEILDSAGKSIKQFKGTSADKEVPDTPAGDDEDDDDPRPKPEPKPSVKAGLHRFTWDLRYPGGTEFPGIILWAANRKGPVAPPGDYQVKLSAAGETLTQRFTIGVDPRFTNVSAADLGEQFKLALQVRDKFSEGNEAVVKIRAMKDQIKDRLNGNKKPSVKAAGEALTAKLGAIEGEIYQVKNQSSQDPLNFPIKLNNKLAALQGVVDSSNGRPTAQSYQVFNELSAKLDAQLKLLDQAIQVDVTKLNAMLRSQKLPTIDPSRPLPAKESKVPSQPER